MSQKTFFRCLVCGRPRDEVKFTCDKNHKYEEYKKIKSKVWNDPWPYFPISFGGWAFMSSLLLVLIGANNLSTIQLQSVMPYVMIPSLIVPITIAILFHKYRQDKKNLPFWGLTEIQEEERILGPITKSQDRNQENKP